nr:hypothetical protein Iba_scaffold63362CG0010 [Ipomoea batatas]GMD94411.1 hypothetical protein Iba_chr15aCG2240 [Ipomoea batatas]GMD99237.1 hypothetical protein Iba_chr15eCG1880 [Ipomoea batatas]GME00107.1 hypothetical protein Iba_chr15fCG2200 [Ipomoea batatas]GME09195.1 hypothetical protein Iba_scaffold8365CG0040 [Ipomoea batatas]
MPKTSITVPNRYISGTSTSNRITFARVTTYAWNAPTTQTQPCIKQRKDPIREPQTARIAKKRHP